MSILGPAESDDFETASLAAIDAATRSDWRAAAWRLQHSPETRERYSDWGRTLAMQSAILDRVVKAADLANLGPEKKYQFLLALQSVGLPTDKDYADGPEAEQ